MEALKDAYSEQNLDDLAYERRLTQAMEAESIEELEAVIADFPPAVRQHIFPPQQSVQPPRAAAPARGTYSDAPTVPQRNILSEQKLRIGTLLEKPMSFFSILGSQKIDMREAELVGEHFVIDVESILGETVLDLRNEDLDGKSVEVRVSGVLNELKILLPPGAVVQRNIQLFAGDFSTRNRNKNWFRRLTGTTTPEPEVPINYTFTVSGSLWLGSVKVVY